MRCAAVVKADAYGLGADRVAPALAEEGCDTFFVAHLGEGIALRKILGAAQEIFVLNGLPPGSEELCVAAGLVPVLNSEAQLAAWRDGSRARRKNVCRRRCRLTAAWPASACRPMRWSGSPPIRAPLTASI